MGIFREAETKFIRPTLGHALRIWWALAWRSIVGWLIATGLVACLRLILEGIFNARVATFAVFLVSLGVQVVALRIVLDTDFGDFSVCLLPKRLAPAPASEQGLPAGERGLERAATPAASRFLEPSLGHTLTIWWALTWRVFVWAFGASFLAGALISIPQFVILLSALVSCVASVLVLKRLLTKEFRHFRIQIVSTK